MTDLHERHQGEPNYEAWVVELLDQKDRVAVLWAAAVRECACGGTDRATSEVYHRPPTNAVQIEGGMWESDD